MPTSRVFVDEGTSRVFVRSAPVGPLVDQLTMAVDDLAHYTVDQLGLVPATIIRIPTCSGPVYAQLKGPTNTVEALGAYTVDQLTMTVDQMANL